MQTFLGYKGLNVLLLPKFFAPLCTVIAQRNGTLPSGADAMQLGLQLAKSASEGTCSMHHCCMHFAMQEQRLTALYLAGKLPSDELVGDVLSFLKPKGFKERNPPKMSIPPEARQAFETVTGPSTSTLKSAGLLPMMTSTVEILEQIPLLIEEVAEGARDFIPPPDAVRAAIRKAYRARRTLILEFADDSIDESGDIEDLLKEAERIIRMKRPMVTIDLQRRTLQGTHVTPLLAPPLGLAVRAEDVLGSETAKDTLLYEQTDATVEEVIRWLEESNL